MNKKFYIGLLLFSCFVTIKAQKSIDTKQLFDFNWKFALGDFQDASLAEFDDQNWRNLDLPHDWSIEGKIEQKNPMAGAGGYFPAGTAWYRKKFFVPADWKDKKTELYFEGVYMNAEVYVNGKLAGMHPYGYTSFYINISDYLIVNQENVVSVKVDNSAQINCRWYSGSGIYRHIWLQVKELVHLKNWGVAVTTSDVSNQKATVLLKTCIENETNSARTVVLSAHLKGKSGSQKKQSIECEIPAKGQKEISQTFVVEHPYLWSPETPSLYKASIQLTQNKKKLDSYKESFGIRSVSYSAEKGFVLNGKSIKLNGGCVHHDHGCLGAASYDRAEERKVKLLKESGFNAVRTSHNPPAEAFLDACDKYGLLVIDEAFDGWRTQKNPHDYAGIFDSWSQRDMESMVLRDRNHPSVVMWSIGNEIIERKSPEAVETAKKLVGYAHAIDPTRPVTSAMTTWNEGWDVFDPLMAAHDICGYNYQLHEAPKDHQRVPERVIVQTESYPREAFKNWKAVQEQTYVIGDFVWTAMDYLGESGIGRWYYPGETKGEHWEADLFPWHGAYCGDIDLCGWRKPISHYRNLLWNNSEKLYMAVKEPNPEGGKISETMWSVCPTWESWTWPGKEGQEMQVEIYSKYPAVRLYLNNRLIGEKATTQQQEFKAVFSIPYLAGELKAEAVNGSDVKEAVSLNTVSEPARIKLSAKRKKVLASGQDLCFVTAEILDKNGNLQPNADNKLEFELTGPGVIVGVDNANLKDIDPYTAQSRKAWRGRAMVVLKSTQNAGKIYLKAKSKGIEDGRIVINAIKKK